MGRLTDESNDHEDALENDDRNAHLGLVADVGSDPQKPDGEKIGPCGEKTGFQSSIAHTLYMNQYQTRGGSSNAYSEN